MRTKFLIAVLLSVGLGALSQFYSCAAQSADYEFVTGETPVKDKAFYLLTLFEKVPEARNALKADIDLAQLDLVANERLEAAWSACNDMPCVVDHLMLSDEHIILVGDRLAAMAQSSLQSMIRDELRPSGVFQRYAQLEDSEFLRAAWKETAQNINRLYRVYGVGETPRYPKIDAISFAPDDSRFLLIVKTALESSLDENYPQDGFLHAWSQPALDLLIINQRDEAIRYEPLEKFENRAAIERAKSLDFSSYDYTAILIPGSGLRNEEIRLSAIGEFRIRMALRRWEEGMAPFLIVSGGHVHPNKTLYNEAIEMKAALMARYGVPESSIFIDPHARHTTTNLRNAARLLFRSGISLEKPILITTTRSQSAGIESDRFVTRCDTELGYQPHEFIERLSPNDIAVRLSVTSLHRDAVDPLDP